MTFDLQQILKSKADLRQRLAARPIGEKLRLLDELRERTLAIAASRNSRRTPQSDSRQKIKQ